MGETTKIEWADHFDPNPTGKRLGVYKQAAKRTGLTYEEWRARRMAGQRRCYRCKVWKGVATFHIDSSRKTGRSSICKPCLSTASTASRYKMTRAELATFKSTRKACEICGSAGKLVIDHNHETGRVRGVLCHNCNSAIGKLREEPTLFRSALAYLEKNSGR